ncbi:MAG: alpha-L-fucosidase [Bacteroidales bacterium]|nr:alpha-L-fucosidase [Bacteroidales bacterium]
MPGKLRRAVQAVIYAFFLISAVSCYKAAAPEPYGPVPSESQLEWQKMETNMFVHFGPNTFSGLEWGEGTEAEDSFCPTALDCRQWAETASKAGFKGIIITAKHHDGFCLWPSSVSSHSVAQSKWKDGRGDVLKELSEACREYGLKFGVYLSPWDRNHPSYGTAEYNKVYVQALREVHSSYGEIFEHWFDGACGEGPNGKRQEYDWEAFRNTVRELSPSAVMFSDVGPDCRWVGNENGRAGETNWSRLDVAGFTPGAGAPPVDTLMQGNRHGACWVPAETDVSIRPGWFWRASEDELVKTPSELADIYFSSVGRNSLLLLNVPPDSRGRIHENDSLALMAFRARIDGIFSRNLAEDGKARADACRGARFRPSKLLDGAYDSYWAVPDGELTPAFRVDLPEERTFNVLMLQEYIPLGQRVAAFRVEALQDGAWKEIAAGTTIGYKRLLRVPVTTTKAVRVSIDASMACPVLNGFGLYFDSESSI